MFRIGFEHQAAASVVGKDLIDGSGAGVSRNDEHPQGRLLGRFQVRVLFLCLVEAGFLDAVFVHIVPVELAELVVDGLCETSAEGEPAFAGKAAEYLGWSAVFCPSGLYTTP